MEDKSMTKDNNLGKNVVSGEMVTTLDGRVINKKDIKIGEIYINAEGKKVRKVVKKVIRTTISKKGAKSQPANEKPAVKSLDVKSSENPSAEKTEKQSTTPPTTPKPVKPVPVKPIVLKPMERPVAKPPIKTAEPKPIAKPEPVAKPEPKKEEVKPAAIEPEKASEKETKEENSEEKKSFIERINSRHSFLDKIKNNEKISSTPVTAKPQTEEVEEEPDNTALDENVEPDRSVAALETAVVDENFANSLGMGSSYASGANGPESKVSGAATNPNASPTAIMSQAGNPISQSLTGNSVPLPINKSLPKAKPKKKRKPIKLWIPTVILASAYVVACVVYFVTGYNFTDKSIDIGKYYIAIGDESKKEYYDGQKFNFYELIMTYYWSNENVEEYDLTKFHMVEPTKSMGYTLNNGYINGIWDGEYAKEEVEYRDVRVKFLYKEETCYVPVRIYKNVLTSLNCYSSIRDLSGCKQGDGVSVTVFGVYTNKVMVDEGINSIERKMDAGEYDLWIHLYREDTRTEGAYYYKHQKLEFDSTTNTYILPRMVENFTVKYKDTYKPDGTLLDHADDLKITANSVKDYNINCYTYDKYGVETFDKVENPSLDKADKPFTIMTINSQLSAEREELVSARFNEPFTFSIKPNVEQGYTLRAGYSVSYNIMNSKGEYLYKNFKVLDKDSLNNYRIEREEISGKIVIKVIGCYNTYNATFYTKENSSAEYKVYTTDSIVKGGSITCPTAPADTEYFKFLGWAEKYSNGTLGEIITDWSTMVMGTEDRVFEAQYEQGQNNVVYVGNGYEITDLEGNPITSITYGETLTFKLRLKSGYSFGGENVTLYYKTGSGSLQQIYALGHTTSKQYDEDDRYVINGELLTGDLTFDLNMLYKVTSNDNRFTVNVTEIRKVVGSSTSQAHIKITLKSGFTAGEEVPELLLNGEVITPCTAHSSGNEYCYYISRAQVIDNVNITVNGIVGLYNIVPVSGDGGTVNFKVKNEDSSMVLTSATIGTEDLKFTVVANEGYDLTSATVVVEIGGVVKPLTKEGDVYTLANEDFSGLTSDIVIRVTGITQLTPDNE